MVCEPNRQLRAFLLQIKFAGFILGFILVAGGAQVCIPAEPDSPQTIIGRLSGQNGFAWRYAYDIEFKNDKVCVTVAVNLIAAGGVTKPELDRVKPVWKEGIEKVWSDRFAISAPSGNLYPIVIDVFFNAVRYHHDVIVRPGGGRSDQLNWNILDSPAMAAHEFGHMVGVYDEYRRGALAPQTRIIDPSSIMTSNPTSGMTYARHYQGFLAWFTGRTGNSDIALVEIQGGQGQYPSGKQIEDSGQEDSNRNLAHKIRVRM
jgi:hypothetical protein